MGSDTRIGAAERDRRAEIVRYARGGVALSGFKVLPETLEIDRRYVDGEIDMAQLTAEYLKLAGLPDNGS